MLNTFAAVGLCLLLPATGFCQQLNGISTDPKLSANGNPDGTSLGSIHSPNLYDGSTTINIPVFQYSSPDGDNYGVSLSYNTRGIKAEQLASVAGLGFTLSAGGGSIQRIAKDIPDELFTPVYTDLNLYEGPYVDFTKMRGRYNASFETPSQASETDVYRDKESDDFIVSIGSLSFTFNIGKGRAIFTHPDRRVKVEVLYDGTPVESLGSYPTDMMNKMEFRITDEQGVQYYFKEGGKERRTIESLHPDSYGNNGIVDYYYITNWVIDKITASNGAVIQFTYNNITEVATSYPGSASYPYSNLSAFEDVGQGVSIGAPFNWDRTSKVVKKITYPNNTTVDFLYEDNPNNPRCDVGPAVLRKIKVSSADNCLYYLLDQSYFVAATPGNTVFDRPYGGPCTNMSYNATANSNIQIPSAKAYALKLKGISIQSCDGLVTEPYYTFEYDQTPIGVRGSGQDYFGYYNGKSATGTASGLIEHVSIPFHQSITGGNYGQDKTPDINYMKAGVLTVIRNAYRGEISFEYGTHTSLTNPLYDLFTFPPISGNFLGEHADDGLCLKSIMEKEDYHLLNYKKTTFDYENGQRFLTGGYFHSPVRMINATSNTPDQVSFMSSYVTPHQFVNGSNHGYGKVTVTVKDNNNALLSRQEITYTNFKDATSNNLPRYLLSGSTKNYFDFPYTDKQYIKDWEMGLPLTMTAYDQNNRVVKKTENVYEFNVDNTSSVSKQVVNQKLVKFKYSGAPTVVQNWGPTHLNVPDSRTATDDYHPYTGAALLVKSRTYTYLSDINYTLDSALYSYDGRNNLKDVITNNSDGTRTKTINYYNYAVASPSGTLLAMNNAGLEKQLGSERWILNGSGAVDRIVDASFNAYNYNSGKLSLRNMYNLMSSAPISAGPSYSVDLNATFSGSAISNFQKSTEVILSDTKGNPLESKVLDQDIYKAMIWDDVSGQKLAEANCRYQDIAYSGFETTTTGKWVYNQANVVASSTVPGGGINGKSLLSASSSNPDPIHVIGLTVDKEYIINFWCKGGTPTLAGGGLANIPLTVIYSPGNGWSYFEARFTPTNNSQVGLVASGSAFIYYIDEMRLFPSSAMMQSWTYEPLFGMSSTTDARGTTLFYEYDKLGRQTIVRDQQRNILSKVKQVVQGQQ